MRTETDAKRNQFTICPVCGETFRQDGIGRYRTYCTDACRMKAHRRKVAHKPARKELNTIRTDYLEQQIGYHEARCEYAAVDALRGVAREVSAPIDSARVAYWRDIYATEVTKWTV